MKNLTLSVLIAMALTGRVSASNEVFLEAPGPQGPLKGTLLAPAAAGTHIAPLVLIIPGSGPTDRDSNSTLGVKAATYRLLAEALAAKGVSSLRIDKRGMFASGSAIPDANRVTISDYADDLRAWVSVAKAHTGLSCVWVLGHSEGGLVALAAAQQPQDLCGLILVAALGRPLGEVLREQLKVNPANAPLLKDAEGAIAMLERGERVDVAAMHPALQRLFAPGVQQFLISTMKLSPAALIGAYQGPVLVVQGGKDLQVSVEDARRLGQANARAKVVIFNDVNHVLKAVAGNALAANYATYANPTLPLAPEVADVIVDFVQASRPAR
jgi:pimeloyl-ACP methyl ester carboxylesterase